MSDFTAFVDFGFRHITGAAALDHLLFLVALVAPYRPRDWRHLLGVASAFTVGHSITLMLVATGTLRLPVSLVEFLIPVTIVVAGLENLRAGAERPRGWTRPLLAAGFGLIHGAGFAGFLAEMLRDDVLGPLLAFNIGIELGQILVLAIALVVLTAADRMFGSGVPGTIRPRRVAASLIAVAWAAAMAVQRTPW